MTILKHPRLKKNKKIEISVGSGNSFFTLALASEGVNIHNYSACDICFHVCWGGAKLEASYAADITPENYGMSGSRIHYNAATAPKAFLDKAIKMGLIKKRK